MQIDPIVVGQQRCMRGQGLQRSETRVLRGKGSLVEPANLLKNDHKIKRQSSP
jgi:hypothetical protein